MRDNNQGKILGVDFECTSCQKNQRASQSVPINRVIAKLDSLLEKNKLDEASGLLEYWLTEAKALNDLHGELSIVNEKLGLTRKLNKKQEGLTAVARTLELIQLTNSQDNLSSGTIIVNAATTSKSFGELDKALKLYEKANEIYLKHLKEDDLRFSAFYNNYATALAEDKQFEKAKTLYEKAIEITKKQVESFLDCAITYVNLAHLYEEQEGIESINIVHCLDKAQTLIEDERIKRDGYYAFVCSKCAPSFDYFGYFALAEELQKISKDIYERD